MKLFITSIFILSVGILQAQEFTFEKELINYGKIAQGANGTKVFTFTNTGTQPLQIQQILSTCGCAVSKKPEKPIMPGKKGSIEVSYNTKNLGSFSKMFTVVSNAKTKRKTLKIKGFVTKA